MSMMFCICLYCILFFFIDNVELYEKIKAYASEKHQKRKGNLVIEHYIQDHITMKGPQGSTLSTPYFSQKSVI